LFLDVGRRFAEFGEEIGDKTALATEVAVAGGLQIAGGGGA
jgi:hypothetical protein